MKKFTLLVLLAAGTFALNFSQAQCVANGTLTPTGTPGEFTITDLSTSSNPANSYSFFTPGVSGASYVYLQPNTTTGTFQYPSNGSYSYGFTIFDSITGCSDYFFDSITVTGISNPTSCMASFILLQDSLNPSIYNCWNTSTGGSPAVGLVYFWDFGDGTTSTLAYPTHTYSNLGTFTLCLTVSEPNGNCTTTYCDTVIVSVKASGTTLNVLPPGATASINELENLTALTLYPSPTENNFTIDFSALQGGTASISIVDVSGKINSSTSHVIHQGNNKLNFNASELKSGIYFVKITDEKSKSTQTLRLIKN
jgi:PKD repeat protein